MDNIEPIRRAFRNAGLYHHAADDLLCSQLADAAAPPAAACDCDWPLLGNCESCAPPAALPEPLFLLHTGAVYGNERGDWEIEANSGKAVDAYCDANPGKTVGLYLATQAPPAPAVPEDARDAARYRWLVDSGTDTYSMFVEAESKAKLDAAIDAAIAAAQAKGVGRE